MSGRYERITLPAEMEVISRSGGDGRTVAAYAAVFNVPARVRDQDGDYYEQNAPAAFSRGGLNEVRSRVFSLYHHGKPILGDRSQGNPVPIGTPKVIQEDSKGLYTETSINRGAVGDQLLEAVHNKALRGMSYTGAFLESDPPLLPGQRYRPGADGKLPLVTRRSIRLFEYGLTPTPTFEGAEVVGVRSLLDELMAGQRAESTAGPQPYQRQPGEDVQCPACLKFNDTDADFCDQCGAPLPGWGVLYQRKPGEDLQCPDCGSGNMTDAQFCDQCGHQLPSSAYDAAAAAKGAAREVATSSSGRQPAGTERSMPEQQTQEETQDPGQAETGEQPTAADRAAALIAGYLGWTPAQLEAMRYTDEELKLLVGASRASGPPRPYGDVEYADAKHGKYPIDAEHVESAWRYINKPENASFYPKDGVTLSEVKGRIKAAMKKHGHEVSDDDNSSSTSSSGRSPESQAAASRGGAEPQARSASNDRAPHEGGSTMPEQSMTVEERAARQAEIRRRVQEIDTQYNGAALPQPIQAEWDALIAENSSHDGAIKAQNARSQALSLLAASQEGVPGADPDSGYAQQAAADRNGTTLQGGSGPALVQSSRQLGTEIWDLSTARHQARSTDDLPHIYRERASRILEFAHFPAEPARKREEVQGRVEGLLHRVGDPHGEIAQRMLATGSPVYQRAFGKTLLSGPQSLSSEEQLAMSRALQIGSPPSFSAGSFPVPYQVDPTVTLTTNGVINALRQIARTEQITGREWLGVTSTGVTVSRAAESAATTDAAPAMLQPGVAATRVQAFVPFSVETEQDWNGLLAEISAMLADAKDIEEATSFLTGNGTAPQAQGVITGVAAAGSAAVGVNAKTAGTIAAQDVYDLEDAMPPRFRAQAVLLSSKTGYNNIRLAFTQFAASAGDVWVRPSQGTPPELLGYPAYENSNMIGTIGGQGIFTPVMVMGDFKQFLIVDRIGMSVELVPHVFNTAAAPGLGFPVGQRGIYAMWRNNSIVLVPNAFRMLVST